MAKILLGIIAVIASAMLAESLTCNKCSASAFGICVNSGTVDCTTNTSQCITSTATFPSVTSFKGFSTQGCAESDACALSVNNTINGTLSTFVNITYQVNSKCCTTDKCNPVSVNGAPSTKMTLSVALSAAAMAAVLGSLM